MTSFHNNAEKQPSILIVDDVPGNIKVLISALADEYELFFSKNGKMALELLASQAIDLVLLDIMMPDIDGYEVCRRIKSQENTREIPVIFVTAKTDVIDEAYAFEIGAVDFLIKPVSTPVVKARVRTHLKLKNIQARLKQQNEELINAAKLREEIDLILRHDLKGPLNAMLGFSDLLRETLQMNEEQTQMCQLVVDAGYSLLGQINHSLDLVKMENGTYKLSSASVDLVKVFGKLSRLSERKSLSRKIDFQIHIDGRSLTQDDSFLIIGDESLCFSLFNNLINNAMEASPSGGTVHIDMLHGAPAEIKIGNSGEVPEEIRERFFEKFVTKGKKDGTGLGTYSAKLMALTQNGTIRLDSSVPNRTTIIVGLPNLDDPSDSACRTSNLTEGGRPFSS
ncbi:MAG: hybrid sensor histidine kinase/response regulator [Magnetococcales bacterium]|nr:hybrid sensor histidine kinase/response regulator [Magnetococcales bacterium]